MTGVSVYYDLAVVEPTQDQEHMTTTRRRTHDNNEEEK
jgi:hypothetical protein